MQQPQNPLLYFIYFLWQGGRAEMPQGETVEIWEDETVK